MPARRLTRALAILALALLLASISAATEKTLHNFNGSNGFLPSGGLIFDAAGNLYGTTRQGGIFHNGTVFQLTPNGSGGWTAKTLHNFRNGTDGQNPTASLIFDSAGNLYGTTFLGGDHMCNGFGCGTVFELIPTGSGGWEEKKLHNFGNGTDGANPSAGLVFDSGGNLYGTTTEGGTFNKGTVFELTPDGDGSWTEKKLHNFGNGMDGYYPQGGLIFDNAGNLYGTTSSGGNYTCPIDVGCGTVFELTPNGNGGWTERVLHNFGNGLDGTFPIASLIFDSAGNLYGTTNAGGVYCEDQYSYGCGTVFEMTPNGSGGWREKLLHSFGNGLDGVAAGAGLIFDAAGNLYSTAWGGGDYTCYGFVGCGTVFELTPNGSGGWREMTVHNFGNGLDGIHPGSGVVIDGAGNLYGPAQQGGVYMCQGHGCGTVFEVTP